MVTLPLTEARSLLVRHLADLPLATTLVVRLKAAPSLQSRDPALTLLLTTSRARASAPLDEGVVCCTPLEYEALALVLEDGRCSREEALVELARKTGALGHTITLASLVGTAYGRDGRTLTSPVRGPMLAVPGIARDAAKGGGPRWTIGEFVDALGGKLVDVEVSDG